MRRNGDGLPVDIHKSYPDSAIYIIAEGVRYQYVWKLELRAADGRDEERPGQVMQVAGQCDPDLCFHAGRYGYFFVTREQAFLKAVVSVRGGGRLRASKVLLWRGICSRVLLLPGIRLRDYGYHVSRVPRVLFSSCPALRGASSPP